MTRWRSPRQRRDAAHRRRRQARARALWEAIEGAPLATGTELITRAYGLYARQVPSRHGAAVEVIGDGWRVTGPLAELRPEIEQHGHIASHNAA